MTTKTSLSDFNFSLQLLSSHEMQAVCGGGFHKHHFITVQPEPITSIEVTDVYVHYGQVSH